MSATESARTRWGKAGQRLDPVERAKRASEIRADRARRRNDDAIAYRRWRDGLVSPALITRALDAKGLYGPEVDEACGTEEPAVDEWEAGERYPTWDQLLALSELTGCTPRFFTEYGPERVPIWSTTLWHHMSKAEREAWRRQPPPLSRFPRAVLDARPPSPDEMPA